MPAATKGVIEVDGVTVEEVVEFDYVSDMLSVGEEAHVTVVNTRRKYTAGLQIGSPVAFTMQHPDVNGGRPTVKHRGIILDRSPEHSPQGGSTISLVIPDLGWHLRDCCAPLWFNLRRSTYADLCDPTVFRRNKRGEKVYFIDPSFGIKGVRFEGDLNRRLKLGLAQVAVEQNRVIDQVYAIQIEPGDKILDRIVEYARRLNRLVNVSVDGYLQVWNPNYDQKPLYSIYGSGPRCNVLRARGHQTARTVWTTVECVGQQIGYEGSQDVNDPNAQKKRGAVYHPNALPFEHRLTFTDAEMFQSNLAQKAAEWRHKRGLFDHFWVEYTLLDHHQNGTWWESDTMAHVEDEELGLFGNFYVQAAHCSSNAREGDLTRVIIRIPGLLSAAFGELPTPHIASSTKERSAKGTTSEVKA